MSRKISSLQSSPLIFSAFPFFYAFYTRKKSQVQILSRKANSLEDFLGQLINLSIYNALDALSLWTETPEKFFGFYMQHFHICSKCVTGFDVASQHNGFDALFPAQLKAQLPVNDLDILLPQLLKKVQHPLPGGHIELAPPLQAGNEKVGNGLSL